MGLEGSKNKQQFLSDFDERGHRQLDGLGEFRNGVDRSTNKNYLIVVTNYSIPNKELAESELRSLQRINEIPTSVALRHFQIVKDKILCFDNYNMELVFETFPTNLEMLMK